MIRNDIQHFKEMIGLLPVVVSQMKDWLPAPKILHYLFHLGVYISLVFYYYLGVTPPADASKDTSRDAKAREKGNLLVSAVIYHYCRACRCQIQNTCRPTIQQEYPLLDRLAGPLLGRQPMQG